MTSRKVLWRAVATTRQPGSGPPAELDGASVVCWADVSGLSPTGVVKHFADDVPQRDISQIAVAQYSGDADAYLFHCNREWRVVNDDLYESAAEAIAGALLQYAGLERASFHEIPRG